MTNNVVRPNFQRAGDSPKTFPDSPPRRPDSEIHQEIAQAATLVAASIRHAAHLAATLRTPPDGDFFAHTGTATADWHKISDHFAVMSALAIKQEQAQPGAAS